MGTLKSGRNRCSRHRKKQILRSNFPQDRLHNRFPSFFFFSLLWFSQCPSCPSHSTPNSVISKCSVDTSQGSSSEGLSAASHASQNKVAASPESVLDCLLLSPAESDENRRWERSTSSTLPFCPGGHVLRRHWPRHCLRLERARLKQVRAVLAH